MGDILAATCPCGLNQRFKVGVGEQGIESKRVPVYCKECNEFFLLKYPQGIDACPKCEKMPTLYGTSHDVLLKAPREDIYEYSIGGTHFQLLRKGNFCPKCGRNTLKFTDAGFWD